MGSITSANAIFTISIAALFPSPQQLQGFAVDDMFDTQPLDAAEVVMGVDGVLSAGFVYVPFVQTIALQSDSPSNDIFDTWWLAQQQFKDLYFATGQITLPSRNKTYSMDTGVLKTHPAIPDAKRTLQHRRYGVTWRLATPSNIA